MYRMCSCLYRAITVLSVAAGSFGGFILSTSCHHHMKGSATSLTGSRGLAVGLQSFCVCTSSLVKHEIILRAIVACL